MRVLVACEFSGVVREAFRAAGHDAYSCDLLPAGGSDGYHSDPTYHLQCDVREVLGRVWDLVIAHPPCTDLAVSGARWFAEKRADGRQAASAEFFRSFVDCAPRWCIENPVGVMSRLYRQPDQIIQPWQFGHGETKATCLWLGNLPPLVPTTIVAGREARVHRMAPSPDRWKLRSITYTGVAAAMAAQWGTLSPINR